MRIQSGRKLLKFPRFASEAQTTRQLACAKFRPNNCFKHIHPHAIRSNIQVRILIRCCCRDLKSPTKEAPAHHHRKTDKSISSSPNHIISPDHLTSVNGAIESTQENQTMINSVRNPSGPGQHEGVASPRRAASGTGAGRP